jgi:hypothetical protein
MAEQKVEVSIMESKERLMWTLIAFVAAVLTWNTLQTFGVF